MDTKKELLERLNSVFPGAEEQIAAILTDYRVTRETGREGGKERTAYFPVRAKFMLQEYIANRRGGEALFASSRAPYGAMKPRAVERVLQKPGERVGGAEAGPSAFDEAHFRF